MQGLRALVCDRDRSRVWRDTEIGSRVLILRLSLSNFDKPCRPMQPQMQRVADLTRHLRPARRVTAMTSLSRYRSTTCRQASITSDAATAALFGRPATTR